MAYLALVRHGQSEWNAQGLWTGWTDIPLSEQGHEEAKKAAEVLKDIEFNMAYTSLLTRAQQTLEDIKKATNRENLTTLKVQALNEKNYGDLAGKNKWKIKEEFGEEQFLLWRRSWDYPLPNGESLKDVYKRVVPYYTTEILPKLQKGLNVLVVAHGNSLRALVKYLENISDEEIPKLEIGTGEVYLYDIDTTGKILSKEIRNAGLVQ